MSAPNLKPRVLVVWSNAYTLHEEIVPLLPRLAEEYEVYVLLRDFHTRNIVLESMKSLRDSGVVRRYWLAPGFGDRLRVVWYLRRHLQELRSYEFDLMLAGTEEELIERCMFECVASDACVRVTYWPQATYLFRNEELTRGLLGEEASPRAGRRMRQGFSGWKLIERLRKDSMSILALKTRRLLWARARRLVRPILEYYARVLLPSIFLRRTFRLRPLDRLTHVGCGRSDAVIFVDELEARAHDALFEETEVRVAEHPSHGNCRCSGEVPRTGAILSPLSVFTDEDFIPEVFLDFYRRDTKTVMDETGANNVHLRLHPRESGKWPYRLRDYLAEAGIPAQIVGSDCALREIVCDYAAVAGPASNSLRVASASCDHVPVIGFVAFSKNHRNPRFADGTSAGIGWIEKDGSYDPRMFKPRLFDRPPNPSINQVLREVSVRVQRSSASASGADTSGELSSTLL